MTRRASAGHWLILVGCVVFGATRPAPASARQASAADPWTESYALEAANNLPQARTVMVRAFGPLPQTYDACLRLAWLALRLREGTQAVALYRRATQLAGAGPAAREGLLSALTMAGYQALDRGDLPTARRNWQEATSLSPVAPDASRGLDLVGPSRSVAPEVWVGHFRATPSSSSANAFYVHIPARVNDRVTVRGAYREIAGASSDATGTPLFGTQHELYGGVTFERGPIGTEVMAMLLSNTLDHVRGVASGTRIGGRLGATFTVSALHQAAGWNTQVLPQVFVWARPWLALAGGVRVTHAPAGSSTSAVFGATIRAPSVELDGQFHVGTERFAFSMAGPTVMSFDDSTTHGGVVTASFRRSGPATVYAQAQVETLGSLDTSGAPNTYFGLAFGVRWDSGKAHRR